MTSSARRSEAAFRDARLARRRGFVTFFRAFTPVDELALLEIGSRPAARRPRTPSYLQLAARDPVGLRVDAEPLPAAGLVRVRQRLRPDRRHAAGLDQLRRLYRDWPFFRSLVENLEMTLAKSSLEIAREYLDLVPESADPSGHFARDRGRARAHARGRARDRRGRACSTGTRSSSARSGSATRTSTR